MKKLLLCIVIFTLVKSLTFSQVNGSESTKAGVSGYSPSLFYYVVLYRTALGLPDYITDTISARADIATALRQSDPDFDIRAYEHLVVKTLLTNDQFTNLLVLRNKPVASEIAEKIWREMLKQKLAADSNDVILFGRIKNYLLTVLVTREYFADNPDEQTRHLDELDKKSPSALYKYYHPGYVKPVLINPYRADYVW
jgi:hypothetical protein